MSNAWTLARQVNTDLGVNNVDQGSDVLDSHVQCDSVARALADLPGSL